ncbi:MAG: Rrf2 family transcriptional regulator [Ferruginibacter sp.]|nr:Rrf2 family transcriptional regulator [Bacteroidota bacterium]MBX2920442.1 Rrf2 family transcriptional regulator [Ferruginibacter sp.]MCB0707905.1 Rrf2 family transcriptional regulator [Chitinophagaceae bacterium]
MFSKACKYGIRSVIYITKQSQLGRKVGLKEIAKAVDSPEAFTAKILQKLCRSKIIKSEKGPTGGFFIDEDKLHSVCLSHVVSTIDGDTVYKDCGLGMKSCNPKKPCPVHNQFMVIRNNLKTMLETTTMLSLASGVKSGLTFLKR